MEKANETKSSPREILIAKELVGFEVKDASTDVAAVKTGVSKSGKALQPSWARG